MIHQNFKQEFLKKNYKIIVGIDEAGRGPLAGPVVAAAVTILNPAKLKATGSFDSKILTPRLREEVYEIIINNPTVEWGIGKVSEKTIDQINILQATKLAMRKAVRALQQKLKKKRAQIDLLILDGNFTINTPLLQKPIVKADTKILPCMFASVIAKVTRDRIMGRLHQKYPQYEFRKHKGYGTKLHLAMLKKYGPCPIHRRSFKPVSRIV